MANWNLPLLTSTYTNFVDEVKNRDVDQVLGLDPAFTAPTNIPTNAIRWSSAVNKWQKWNGTTWNDLAATYAISISGNAGTATALQTARTINGVSFNGTANISVNTNNAVTFNNAGAGAASGTTFNGSAAQTISYNTVGAPSTGGANATGTWSISVTGNAGTVTNGVYTTGNQTIGGVKTFSTAIAIGSGGTGATTAASALVNLGERTGATGGLVTPTGTTAQRPTAATGLFRFNTTLGQFEGYNGSAWGKVGGGATGGGSDDVFHENGQAVTVDYTLSTNKNAVSAGPITINTGITVTVPAGSNWAIV